jgi:hypothetical protein
MANFVLFSRILLPEDADHKAKTRGSLTKEGVPEGEPTRHDMEGNTTKCNFMHLRSHPKLRLRSLYPGEKGGRAHPLSPVSLCWDT